LLRTGEIHDLRGDAGLAHAELQWKPKVDFPTLVRLMVQADIAASGVPAELSLIAGTQ
jgi:GDPmannose 4,6-dehydratase